MEYKVRVKRTCNSKLVIIVVLTLVTSILPEILLKQWIDVAPAVLSFGKLILLSLAYFLFRNRKASEISKYTLVLGVTVIVELLTKPIISSSFWHKTFDVNSFVGNFGSSILLKVIGIIPVVAILLALFKSPAEVYLVKGNLATKADEIKWLSIKKDSISWGKLATISAICISLGTALLTIFTVTGASKDLNTHNLIKYFPFVVILAILNSFCEGVVFRSAILGSLKNVLPKNQTIGIAAMLFGIAHYYGAPSGIVGVVMSGFLGWYLCRSMVETKGFVSSWIIHFMQDVVIFSTMVLLGGFN